MSLPPLSSAAPKPRAIYWVLSLPLAGVLLYFSLRGIEWRQVWSILRGADVLLVLLASTLMAAALFLRGLRWRVLLSAQQPVQVGLAFWASSAGYLGNNLLPARAGEAVRTLIVSRRAGLSTMFVLTTALSERVVDAAVLLALSSSILLTMPSPPGWLGQAARPFAALGLAGVGAIVLIPWFEPFWFRLLGHIPLPAALRGRLEALLVQSLNGFRTFHHPGRLARFASLTGLIWLMDAVTTLVGGYALGLTFSLPVAFLLLAALGLGSALPSTPGYVGIYQFVAVSVLTPFGHSRNDAIAYILLFQAVSYAVIGLLGVVALSRLRR
jgi:uncharacterized membrane protein YbhN (UPF0104 family)